MAPNNPLNTWGNEKTMNLNPLILTNIQASPYFKVNLYELKTYHEVIDEIYYKVDHLEPWEKGSRKTAGQTGMCGGVRGVGAGGIVSSAYCLLYKLYTLKLTRKQLMGLITHKDSPYIRGLGFMYIRYCQDPKEMWDWYEPYLDDEEEIDVKAGGGHKMTIGEVLRQWMVKLEWYCTLFPRIPVPVQKDLMQKLKERPPQAPTYEEEEEEEPEEYRRPRHIPDGEVSFGEAERNLHHRNRSPEYRRTPPRRSPPRRRSRSPRRHRSRSPVQRRSRSPRRHRSRSPYRRRSPPRYSQSRRRSRSPRNDFARELERERRRQERDKRSDRSRSRERQRGHRSRSKERPKHRSRSKERSQHQSRSRSKERMQARAQRSRSGSREKKKKKEKKHKHRSRSKERNSKHKSHSKRHRDVDDASPDREEVDARNDS
ncbi:pre-mRNA-splicing factor 38B-like isoform X1 [Saccostrea cucullata]|uniref:pre-mRNA-splicing factor 38B-like isoform X1 n=2 Tax=Saccostrea cuccullata TaxID=36930 RepID=UPI002ED1C5E1